MTHYLTIFEGNQLRANRCNSARAHVLLNTCVPHFDILPGQGIINQQRIRLNIKYLNWSYILITPNKKFSRRSANVLY